MINESQMQYIISLILDDAYDALEEYRKSDGDKFYRGRLFAYYEILCTLKNQLSVRVENLEDFGLNIDLEKTFLIK